MFFKEEKKKSKKCFKNSGEGLGGRVETSFESPNVGFLGGLGRVPGVARPPALSLQEGGGGRSPGHPCPRPGNK